MSRDIELNAFSFPSTSFQDYVHENILDDYSGNKTPFLQLIDYLEDGIDPACRMVIAEQPYFDKDYLDEISTFYSTSIRDYQSTCLRLHFFSEDIPREDVENSNFEDYESDYLGFSVIRPTDLQKLGRTMIAPPDSDNNSFHLCLSDNNSTLLTTDFEVEAMPFIQQDTQVGACAQASIWMAGRYMSNEFGYRDFHPSEITEFAREYFGMGRPFPARDGLNLYQMLDAFRQMDLSAEFVQSREIRRTGVPDIFHAKARDARVGNQFLPQLYMADVVYKYLESEMPVVLLTKDHVVFGFGHTYDFQSDALLNIRRIPEFIFHNDNAGPYLRLPIPDDENDTADGNPGNFNDITQAIFLLPKECTMNAQEAEISGLKYFVNYVSQLFETDIEQETRDNFQIDLSGNTIQEDISELLARLIFRTYLRRGISFKDHFVSQESIQRDELRDKISRLSFPKYVWIIEFTTQQGLQNSDEKGRRQCNGEIVIDSSSPSESNCVLYFRIGNIVILFDRNEQQPPEVLIDEGAPHFYQHTRSM